MPEIESVNVSEPQDKPLKRGAGGTPGGIGMFFLGVGLAAGGGYLVLNHVTVTSHLSAWGWPGSGGGGFGPLLILLGIGVGVLFFNAKNWAGRILTAGSLAGMIVSVVMNMQMFWQPTSLFSTVAMFAMLAAGIGLVFRSFKASS